MKSLPSRLTAGAWPAAVSLLERWLVRGERVDRLMELVGPGGPGGRGVADRPTCQRLLFGALRHFGRLDAALGSLTARRPRGRLRAVLLVAGFELLEAADDPSECGRAARIVDHAVGQAKSLLSPAEAGLVNAVLRRLAEAPHLRAPPPGAGAGVAELARSYSHPDWLVRRWQAHYGDDATLGLLRWDQTPPPVYARWRALAEPPAWLQPTSWPEFRIIPAGRWSDIEPLLAAGALYLQDPATLAATGLLDPQPGETVLDLCAAPGGKSLLLADLLAAASRRQDGAPNPPDTAGGIGAGRVVAVDLPDERRVGRLRENLAKVQGVDFAVVEADVLQLSPQLLAERGVPSRYSAVLLDAPCSSTGVMRHRVDVKWRLHEADIATHAREQLALLTAAAKLVAGPDEGGGRLVYSTCSLEPEENAGVVEAFLHAASGRFTLEEARHRRPWEDGSDGVSAFRLRRGK